MDVHSITVVERRNTSVQTRPGSETYVTPTVFPPGQPAALRTQRAAERARAAAQGAAAGGGQEARGGKEGAAKGQRKGRWFSAGGNQQGPRWGARPGGGEEERQQPPDLRWGLGGPQKPQPQQPPGPSPLRCQGRAIRDVSAADRKSLLGEGSPLWASHCHCAFIPTTLVAGSSVFHLLIFTPSPVCC